MIDNIVLFYLFFIVVGFFTAMLGTIIGAGGGIINKSEGGEPAI